MSEQQTSPPPSVPNPDPTTRTIEQLLREIGTSRQIVEANNQATREVLETRLAGMDKAIELLQKTTDKLPEQIKDEVTHLEALHAEKFRSLDVQLATHLNAIDKQFAERDKRTDQLSIADKTAIAAALQAQKEAAGAQNDSNSTANIKMEANFAKLIEQTQTLLQEVRRNTDDKINDVKSRLDKGEGNISGGRSMRADSSQTTIIIVAMAALCVSIITGAFTMLHSSFAISSPTVVSPAVIPMTPR